jgi:hypothetical protein
MTRIDRDDEGPIDFGPMHADRLDAGELSPRWVALVGRIEAAAAPELARRATIGAARVGRVAGFWLVDSVTSAVARFAAPALVAAAAAVFAAVSATRATDPIAVEMVASQAISDEVAFQALSLDERADWITKQQAPSADDLARVLDPSAVPSPGEQE